MISIFCCQLVFCGVLSHWLSYRIFLFLELIMLNYNYFSCMLLLDTTRKYEIIMKWRKRRLLISTSTEKEQNYTVEKSFRMFDAGQLLIHIIVILYILFPFKVSNKKLLALYLISILYMYLGDLFIARKHIINRSYNGRWMNISHWTFINQPSIIQLFIPNILKWQNFFLKNSRNQ